MVVLLCCVAMLVQVMPAGAGKFRRPALTIDDLAGRTLECTWETGPRKGVSQLIHVLGHANIKIATVKDEHLVPSIKMPVKTQQAGRKIILLSWRNPKTGVVSVLTLNFRTHKVFHTTVGQDVTFVSQGNFLIHQ